MPEVALITTCAECRRQWLPDDEERWRAYHGIEEHFDELAEVVFYCRNCADREFG